MARHPAEVDTGGVPGSRPGVRGRVSRPGPPLTPAERAIPLDRPLDRLRMAGAALLALTTTLAMTGVCLWLGSTLDAARAGNEPAWWLAVACVGVAAAAEGGRIVLEQTSALSQANHLQRRLVSHALALGPARLSTSRTGSLVNLMTSGCDKIGLYRQTYLGGLIGGLLTPLLALVVMAVSIDAPAALILAGLTPLPPLLIWAFTTWTRKAGGGARAARSRLAARYLAAIEGLETLAVIGAAPRMAASLARSGEANRVATMRMLRSNQLILFIVDVSFYLVFIAAGVAVAAWRAADGAISAGEALSIVALTVLMLEPMAHMGGFFYVGMGGRANEASSRKFLARTAVLSPSRPACVDATAPSLEVRGVSFAYSGRRPVLDGVDLRVAPGEHVAIVGPSGSGKSTLIHLLTGTLVPSRGTLALNGQAADSARLRRASALVAQSTWLFTGTVRDNLALAAPQASEADMWDALTKAHLAAEIAALPAGLDTHIGERGIGLSGGQAQRLSLARAFLSGRRLLVCDEPTSSIDLASEKAITSALRALGEDYTIVMVTHRASSLAGIDRTLVLADGRLKPEGVAS
ncbi:MAG: ABC transporter ATP-binding protein [Actinomycetaceae bacterium]|nr:ABC transporter ATP-binding protein [Actinomycetaceae bacterium]